VADHDPHPVALELTRRRDRLAGITVVVYHHGAQSLAQEPALLVQIINRLSNAVSVGAPSHVLGPVLARRTNQDLGTGGRGAAREERDETDDEVLHGVPVLMRPTALDLGPQILICQRVLGESAGSDRLCSL
jgi:hypothetical protein